MKQNIVYVGIDVDDVRYHGCALYQQTGEILDFHCRPTLKGLVGQLEKLREYFGAVQLKLCYEASYVGFSLQRDLKEQDYDCAVVAPTSIPRRAGKAVKTDRIDATELAEFYANGLLTVLAVPDAQLEQDRDLLRFRQQLVQQQGDLRRHIQSLLRRNGLHYKTETQRKTYWQTHHYGWIERTIETCSGSLKVNLSLLVFQLKSLDETLAAYGEEIEALALAPRYQEPVKALTCYKGIKQLFALTMITEIGDVKRFSHPRQLVSWIGMDIREYASGGKCHRFGITRQGNRLLLAGKHPNKVKVACAREIVGFVWESLNRVAA